MKTFLVLIAAMAVVAAAAVVWLWLGVHQPYRGYSSSEQFVDIPPGLGTRAIGQRLAGAGVVRDAVTFRAALWTLGRSMRLKAGEYRFTDAMTPLQVIDKLRRGDVFVIPITFPEGLNVFEMAKIFEAKG